MGQWRKGRELHWRGVLERHAASGLSVAEFCRKNSILGTSFYSWRRKLKERDAGSQQVNQKVEAQAVSADQLLPVRIESLGLPESVRILLPQGVSLDVPSSIEHSVLTDLLRALGEARRC